MRYLRVVFGVSCLYHKFLQIYCCALFCDAAGRNHILDLPTIWNTRDIPFEGQNIWAKESEVVLNSRNVPLIEYGY